MSDSDIRDIIVLTVEKKYYEKHLEVFKHPNTSIKSVFVEGENNLDDGVHKRLLKAYLIAQKELRDYEYNKRHNK